MNLIKGRIRLFCVSNIIASFACTGLLGPQYYIELQGAGQNGNNEVITTDEVIPLSQYGKGENNIIDEIEQVPNIEELAKKAKENNAKIAEKSTSVTTKSTSKTVKKSDSKKKVTTSVVTKKEVKASTNYAPAVYSEVTGTAIVNYAKKYLGLKYVYAGKSLATGTDCSGFTSLIYKEFGISLPRTVSGQVNKGTYVKKSDLKKGDLVFYSSGTNYATHVSIYIGDGKVIHESNPRDGVKISSVNMMRYITARRVINDTAKKIAEKKIEEDKKVETNVETTVDTSTNAVDSNVPTSSTQTESVENNPLSVSEPTEVETKTETSQVESQESSTVMDDKKEDSSDKVVETKSEPKEDNVEVKEEVKQESETPSENTEN